MKPPQRPTAPLPTTRPPAQIGKVQFGNIQKRKGHRTLLYGTGGIGKTTLACLAPGKTVFIDADESLEVLKAQLVEVGIELPVKVDSVTNWATLRAALQSDGWDGINNIVLDTVTKIEEWGVAHTLATVKTDKGRTPEGIEDYGFGKGYKYVFENFLTLLGDLERHTRAGRNVFLLAHDCTSNVPNPKGEDYLRYEPRLQHAGKGDASVRLRLKEWSDHVLFLGYDVEVNKETGVAQGSGTRTLYASELPFCMAKSRTFSGTINIDKPGDSPWELILK